MGVMAAFIFAAQMFNFQVAGGTSGHLLGGVLAGVLLGPWVGTLVMACVIAVQALVFSDGGIVVMGANIFNMGVVGTLGGFALYSVASRDDIAIAAIVSSQFGVLARWLVLVTAGQAIELAGPAKLFSDGGKRWFAIGEGDEPTITRYTLDDRGHLEKGESMSLLQEAMEELTDREKHILTERRLKDDPVTLEELACHYGVSRERVRQIEVRAFEKLQKAMRAAAEERNLVDA